MCCCLLVCCVVFLFLPSLSFLPNRVLQYFLPPTLLHQVFFACVTGTSTRPLHGHVLGGNGAMPKMDGTSTSGPCTPPSPPHPGSGSVAVWKPSRCQLRCEYWPVHWFTSDSDLAHNNAEVQMWWRTGAGGWQKAGFQIPAGCKKGNSGNLTARRG